MPLAMLERARLNACTAVRGCVGSITQTTALLDQGAALDARDELGRTPLMLAVMQRKTEVVRLLLDRGADPNIADSAGRTPLQAGEAEKLSRYCGLAGACGSALRWEPKFSGESAA